MFSRFARYFDEVARSGSIRRASEKLHVAPSAIDRHILRMEEQLGVPLFERLPQGLRLTAAGEVVVDAVRRWKRDYTRVRSHIDELQGLKRGEVLIAVVEGAMDFFVHTLKDFRAAYPNIVFHVHILGSNNVVDLVINKEVDLGLTFNPPLKSQALRVERTLVYQLGCVMAPTHPLAARTELELHECVDYPLIVPDETLSLRPIYDQVWAMSLGGNEQFAFSVNSINAMKKLVVSNLGIAMLTRMDALEEVRAGTMKFVPLATKGVPLSVLSLITASGRTLPVPVSILLQHMTKAMATEDAPIIDG